MRILSEIDRVCREKGLSYCLAYGTCLGAVRHKGFIPWDDDIDIFMPAEDFRRLCREPDSFSLPFFLQTKDTDPEYGLMIARVRDSETTLIEEAERERNINHGVFVDIYPLFNCPKGKAKFALKHVASMVYRLFLYEKAPRNRGNLFNVGAGILLKVTTPRMRKRIKKKSFNAFAKDSYTGLVSSYYGNDSSIQYRYDWFFPPVTMPFEQGMAPVPANADAFLKFRYGDYMKLPPENERVMHHDFAKLDLDNSFLIYYGKYYCVNKEKHL